MGGSKPSLFEYHLSSILEPDMIRTLSIGLLSAVLLAAPASLAAAQSQGSGKAQSVKKKQAAASTTAVASTSREAKEKVCIQ